MVTEPLGKSKYSFLSYLSKIRFFSNSENLLNLHGIYFPKKCSNCFIWKYTWTCLNIPGLYSSKYFTCHTRKVPSTGCMVKSMSGFLFHSVSSISILRSSRTVGRGTGMLGREQALGLPSRSPSSCSDEPVPPSDSLSSDNSELEKTFIRMYPK